MKRLPGLIVVMVMIVFAGDIHAASLLGPAGGMGEQKAGAFSVGAGYFFYDDYWKDGGGYEVPAVAVLRRRRVAAYPRYGNFCEARRDGP